MPEPNSTASIPSIPKLTDYYSVNREIEVSLEQSTGKMVVQPALPGPLNPPIPKMTEYY